MNLDNSILIVPTSEKKEWLIYRNEHPFENFHLYSLNEFLSLFRYSYEEGALTHLLEKGYGLSKATSLLSSLSQLTLKDEVNEELKLELAELVNKGLFYNEGYPEKLLEGKKIYYSDIDELAFKEIKRFLPNIVFTPLEKTGAKEIHPVYRFSDSYKEIHYLLNDIASEIDSGRDSQSIFIFGASNESKNLLRLLAPRYGYEVSGLTEPLSSNPTYKKFLASIKEDVSDRETLLTLEGEEEVIKKIASLVKTFEGFGFLKRKQLYKEYSHSLEVNVHPSLSGPSLLSSPHVPKDSLIYVIDASLGCLPSSTGEDFFLSDEEKSKIGLITSKEKNYLKEKEARRFLSSPSIKWISYAKRSGSENVEPSFLLSNIGEAQRQDYEYDHDEGTLFASFLLDEASDSGHKDGRLNSIAKDNQDLYGTFPKGYKQVPSFKMPRAHSYSSISNYPKCPYEYYCQKILNVDVYEYTFSRCLGSYFHKAIEEKRKGLTLEEAQESALKVFDEIPSGLSEKEKVLLKKYQDFLPLYLKFIEQFEGGFARHISKNESEIKGEVEEAKYYAKVDKLIDFGSDVVIIDYKTTSAQAFKEDDFLNHALSLQLPFYAMAIDNSPEYANKKVSGIFIAPIVIDNATLGVIDDPSEVEEKKLLSKWRLDGIMGVDRLEPLIGGAFNKENYFTKRSFQKGKDSPHSQDEIEHYAFLASQFVVSFNNKILAGEFARAPWRLAGSNGFNSCNNCSFRDICYRKEDEVKYRDKDEEGLDPEDDYESQ